MAQLKKVIDNNILHNCNVTRQDIHLAENILGTNLGSLKGKTVHRPGHVTNRHVDSVPDEVIKNHQDVTLCVDLMKLGGIHFFMSVSPTLKFGTSRFIPN